MPCPMTMRCGWLTQSWSVFFLALAVLLGGNLYLREIRPTKGNGRGKARK